MTIKHLAKRSLHLIACTFGHRPVMAQVVKLAPSEMLAGRTALITGGTSGIGYAIADAFLSAGADVVLTSRTARRAEEACARLAASTRHGNRGCTASQWIYPTRSICNPRSTVLSICYMANPLIYW